MSRPLHRGASGVKVHGHGDDKWDSQMKDKTEKEEADRRGSLDHGGNLASRLPFRVLLPENSPSKYGGTENGFTPDSFLVGNSRSRQQFILQMLRLSLVLIAILALTGSFWWTLSISGSSQVQIFHGYRRLQEQLVSDLWDIGEISLGPSRLKELELCLPEFENYVPCFNSSDTQEDEYDRHCEPSSSLNCLVQPPLKYKIPLRWPTGRDVIWLSNVKITAQEVLFSGSLTKRMMMLEEDQISFRSASPMFDGVEDYSHQIAEMIGLRNESNFREVGVRTILDIGCGYGSFGAHLFSKHLLTMCIANYEPSGSQVQLTLERGLPAMLGSFTSKQLPFPSLSYDMVHCARCGVDWDSKDGRYLIEVDRVLKPGGYFVWTWPLTSTQGVLHKKENQKTWNFIQDFVEYLCWKMLSQQDETVVWRKTSKSNCYSSRKPDSSPPICGKGHDIESPYYRPLQACIGGRKSRRWVPINERRTWPSRANLNKSELALHGLALDDVTDDSLNWKLAVKNYWSLLSPLIFSDHPKRPGDEDPLPPYNMLRNVLDMNAHYGGFNSALLEAGKSVWVMNVVPTNGPNYLPMIMDRGFIGVLHDWCEAFPTYPRSYDLVHAAGLLSLEATKKPRCSMLDLFIEIDRLLRPEVIISFPFCFSFYPQNLQSVYGQQGTRDFKPKTSDNLVVWECCWACQNTFAMAKSTSQRIILHTLDWLKIVLQFQAFQWFASMKKKRQIEVLRQIKILMAWRLLAANLKSTQTLTLKLALTNILLQSSPSSFNQKFAFSTSFLVTKLPKKFRKKRKKEESPRTKLVQSEPNRISHFERILQTDSSFRFLFKSKDFLSKQPEHVLRLDDAGKLYRELGFPRGRKVARSIERHPLLFEPYRHADGKMWFGFTEFMEELIEEERRIMDSMELDRVRTVRKLLMMSANKRIPLSKIYHCRSVLGIPEDFRDRLGKYPDYFRVVVENDGKRVLELLNWDPLLAVSQLEREFVVNEDKVKRTFKFPVKYGKDLDLDEDDTRKLNLLNTLPLVSPYSDGSKLELWTLEAEKYRVGVVHEFLSLTLEKKASIHHIVAFKEEFSLTKHTYQMLLKQPRTFYLAGTEMNWVVFLKDAYNENGDLIEKDPQVVFNEKLRRYAQMQKME